MTSSASKLLILVRKIVIIIFKILNIFTFLSTVTHKKGHRIVGHIKSGKSKEEWTESELENLGRGLDKRPRRRAAGLLSVNVPIRMKPIKTTLSKSALKNAGLSLTKSAVKSSRKSHKKKIQETDVASSSSTAQTGY